MKRCAQCHGKLGLGVRSRNLWNGLVDSRSLLFGSLRLVMSWSDANAQNIAGTYLPLSEQLPQS